MQKEIFFELDFEARCFFVTGWMAITKIKTRKHLYRFDGFAHFQTAVKT